MSKIMRMNLLKLRKESKRIEFMTVTGQMRALNEIKVKDMKASEDALAGASKQGTLHTFIVLTCALVFHI